MKFPSPPFIRFGIRQKVLLMLMLVLLTTLSISSWFTLNKEKERILRELNTRGKVMAQTGTLVQDSSRMKLFSHEINLDNEKLGKLTLGINTGLVLEHINSQRFKYLKREILITLIIAFGEFFALSYIIIRPVRTISKSLGSNR